MGNYFWAPGAAFLGRKYAFNSAGRSKTGCSPEISESLLEQFSVPSVAVVSVTVLSRFPVSGIMIIFNHKSGRIHYFWHQF